MSAVEVITVAASAREREIERANGEKSRILADANQAFADAIRPIVDSREMTVDQVAAHAGINRARVYELLRLYPPSAEHVAEQLGGRR
jgi:AcrR family transcriptional regulator